MNTQTAYRILSGTIGTMFILLGLVLTNSFFEYQGPGSTPPIETGPVGHYFIAFSGCETNVATNDRNCGTCGTICNAEGGSAVCDEGLCVVDDCFGSTADCNEDVSDGCETDIVDDPSNCGACTAH